MGLKASRLVKERGSDSEEQPWLGATVSQSVSARLCGRAEGAGEPRGSPVSDAGRDKNTRVPT